LLIATDSVIVISIVGEDGLDGVPGLLLFFFFCTAEEEKKEEEGWQLLRDLHGVVDGFNHDFGAISA
jgi:hypothetical protein